ncbi:MAG: hypothetical protein FD153_61 [Rhodospirillaceae bacterium]|nr:MAG: hypothetical protein FD153_61 [Rhodospirillaceae bacterium]
MALAFDTLRIAHHLREGGFFEAHANAITEALRQASTDSDILCATKADIAAVRAEMRTMELRLVIKLGVMLAALFAMTVGATSR